MRGLPKLAAVEAKLFLREGTTLVVGLALPIVLLVVFGSVPAMRQALPELGGSRIIDVYAPILVGLAVASLSLTVLPTGLATYRDKGVLRRLATTPVGPGSLLGAQLVVNLVATLLVVALLVGVAAIAFGVLPPRQVIGFALTLVLLVGSMFGVGLVIAAVAPTGRAANGIGMLCYFPMLFVAGLWTPGSTPDVVARIGEFTPLGAGVDALHSTWAGAWPAPLPLLVMAAYAVGLGVLAARLFRWE
ncbi:ABC transporter permease [Goodfellowiella coeruleoviolacea]|uniref:Transport permease protein n=1 Tax=Goodfellowiella coeruleoviolacea TaxID=334858 RepID=A0AAE3KJU4_9PSEU|nr:ABC transporter permease [Goodfellowiella coeruleoviolacea]MCP2169477.1 ABC-2 type transport system permease protein [Goodfellowiella coeruleoviolacea]